MAYTKFQVGPTVRRKTGAKEFPELPDAFFNELFTEIGAHSTNNIIKATDKSYKTIIWRTTLRSTCSSFPVPPVPTFRCEPFSFSYSNFRFLSRLFHVHQWSGTLYTLLSVCLTVINHRTKEDDVTFFFLKSFSPFIFTLDIFVLSYDSWKIVSGISQVYFYYWPYSFRIANIDQNRPLAQ